MGHELLVPVDEHINDLEREIDLILWDEPHADVSILDKELKHFLSLQADGVLYEPTF